MSEEKVLPSSEYNVSLGALRTFVTLIVVAHHAVLAYHAYAPPPVASLADQPMWWPAFPIVDSQKWPGIEIFVGWNDTFFMSLLFLVSGIFAWPSLERKGAGQFLGDRARRLGIPFVFSALLLAPLAYFPTYLATGAPGDVVAFAKVWLGLDGWPSGPAWFLWVLLSFGALAAFWHRLFPDWGRSLGNLTAKLSGRPAFYFLALVAVSSAAYLPLAAYFTPLSWGHLGPFWIQSGRALHYFVYFLAGIGLGAYGNGKGLMAQDGLLARRWLRWCFAAFLAFATATVAFLALVGAMEKGSPSLALATFCNFTFTLCCAASSLAVIALFLRFARRQSSFFTTLGPAAYGIYIFHYVFVSWLQYGLLGTSLPGFVKGTLVFLGATCLSFAVTASLRKVPALARIL